MESINWITVILSIVIFFVLDFLLVWVLLSFFNCNGCDTPCKLFKYIFFKNKEEWKE